MIFIKTDERGIMLVKLELRKKEECKFDMISLGEIMLRFDPGD